MIAGRGAGVRCVDENATPPPMDATSAACEGTAAARLAPNNTVADNVDVARVSLRSGTLPGYVQIDARLGA